MSVDELNIDASELAVRSEAGTRRFLSPRSALRPLRQGLLNLWSSAVENNLRNIERFAGARRAALGGSPSFCDLGCGDGEITARIAAVVRSRAVDVVEVYPPNVKLAEERGYNVARDDLNGRLSFADETFDLVLSNQVIEHLYDTELFLEEAVRILKPGGSLIVSTENPASWHNIGALVIGWQAFSLANVSAKKTGIGNPLSLAPAQEGWVFPMQHHRLFTPKALRELFALVGLERIECTGAGYYPLPASFGRFDPTHAHFITIVGSKPKVLGPSCGAPTGAFQCTVQPLGGSPQPERTYAPSTTMAGTVGSPPL